MPKMRVCKEEAKVTHKLSTDEFIEKCRTVHSNKFDYSKTKYTGNKHRVLIVCPNHGEFLQQAASHMRGSTCPTCARSNSSTQRTKNTEAFISEARTVHGNTYDYSQVEYTNALEKVNILCNTHGIFNQTANKHLQGQGCPSCGKELSLLTRTSDFESFLRRARFVHGDSYTYHPTKFLGLQHKIEINCKLHGSFYKLAGVHLAGQGCPQCSFDVRSEARRLTSEEFIIRAKAVHGDAYDYSLAEYATSEAHVAIFCHIHGLFSQVAITHLTGHGCPSCATSGFKPHKSAFCYVVKLQGRHSSFVGFGITGSVKRRMAQHRRAASRFGYSIELVHTRYFEDGAMAKGIEQVIKLQVATVDTGIPGFRTEATLPENLNSIMGLLHM